nr:hypothetical protein [Mycobacterium tuberculosis]
MVTLQPPPPVERQLATRLLPPPAELLADDSRHSPLPSPNWSRNSLLKAGFELLADDSRHSPLPSPNWSRNSLLKAGFELLADDPRQAHPPLPAWVSGRTPTRSREPRAERRAKRTHPCRPGSRAEHPHDRGNHGPNAAPSAPTNPGRLKAPTVMLAGVVAAGMFNDGNVNPGRLKAPTVMLAGVVAAGMFNDGNVNPGRLKAVGAMFVTVCIGHSRRAGRPSAKRRPQSARCS